METLDALTHRFSAYGSDAQAMALKKLMQITHRQGVVMAFSDLFLLLTVLFAALALAAIMVTKPSSTGTSASH